MPPNQNIEFVALRLLARLADRHHDEAKIVVFAGAGGFHQWRIGDRQRDALCGGGGGGGPVDGDLDEFARALAVAGST